MKILYPYILCLLTAALTAQENPIICYQEDVGLFPLENINTKSIEFSPTYYQSGLAYVIARENVRFLDPKTGRAYFDLMYADLAPDGDATTSISFSPNIRTQYHEGPCTFNHDFTEMFFTRSGHTTGKAVSDKKGKVQLKIYSATKGNEDWEQITELPFSSDLYSVAHPALSPDGQYLVFSSDMPGGFGGMDLYLVSRADGQWNEPVNLGASINTKGHEIFPSWHAEGYLFFSSDGRRGRGGLDLYVTEWSPSGTFLGLQHLDSPFNSSRDDLGLIVSADGRSGYMASDRKPTKGKDDLYRWAASRSIFCRPVSTPDGPMLARMLTILDEDGNTIENTFVWMIPMGIEGPTLHKELFSTDLIRKDDAEGSFYLRWGVTDTLSAQTADAISDAMGMVTLEVNQKTTYALVAQHNGYIPYIEVMPGENFPSFIQLKKVQAVPASCADIRFTVYNASGDILLNGAKIQLTGPCLRSPVILYTDNAGTATSCLPTTCSVKSEFLQEGYAQHSFSFTPPEEGEHWKIYLTSADALTGPAAPIVTGTVIVLDNIYYDFNKSVIRKGDAEELIALANILKQYPDLTIELTSHTDSRGSSEYNMELSRRRSESSKSYLMLLGVAPSRIITKAAGETAPRNHCLDDVPCSEEEHQHNRRTEVRITNPAQGMEIRYKAEG